MALEHHGPVVLGNQATKRIERLYRTLGYSVNSLDAPRRIITYERTGRTRKYGRRKSH
jgi:hypothetical protein